MKYTLIASALLVGFAGTAEAQSNSRTTQLKGQQGPILRTSGSANGFFGTSNDECATPDPLSGQGAFAYDNTGATTGVEGQVETNCLFFGANAIDNDIWFEWTADATGTATINTCGSGPDTKIAAYASGGCPADESSLACNDDSCGLQSQINLDVTSGTSYLLQVGNFPGSAGGPGVLNISIAGVSSNDDCTTPEAISGQGSLAYDNSSATTGVEGQNEALCAAFGATAIDNDIWYEWTADVDGTAIIDTCGSATDTKIAAYAAGGCPADGSAIACNDDTCSLQSSISFDVTAGTSYLLQLGNFPGSAGGPSTLNIAIDEPDPDCYTYDNGSADVGVGLTGGGEILYLNRFSAIGGSDTISEISTQFGSVASPITAGNAVDIVIYDDPTNDGDMSDIVLLYAGTGISSEESTGTWVTYSVPSVAVSGDFLVGFNIVNTDGEFPAPLDTSQTSSGRAFVAGSVAPNTVDLANPNASDIPVLDMDALGLFGVWNVRARGAGCTTGPGFNYCTSNAAVISASGSTSVAANDLVLSASPVPDGENGIFFYGPAKLDLPFGNGTLCVGGGSIGVARLAVETAAGGVLTHAVDNTMPPYLPVTLTAGSTWYFQAWYRDTAGGGALFDTSNGLQLDFQP